MKKILKSILQNIPLVARAPLLAVIILTSGSWILTSAVYAGNIYPWRIISGATTGEVDEAQFSTSDITLTITNIPGKGRRAIIGIIGGGTATTLLTATNCIQLIDVDGGGTNLAIGVDTNCVSAFLGSVSPGSGITNVLDTAGGPVDLVGATNQPILRIKGLTNQTPSFLTISDFGTMIGFAAIPIVGGSTNSWYTNGTLWATSDAFSFSNASSVVSIGFTNLGGVPTIYLVPDGTIARTSQAQTWSAPQSFNGSATLTFGGSTWAKASMTVSDNLVVATNVTVGGQMNAGGTGTFGHFNAGQIDSGTIDSNRFPVTGITPNSYGDSSHTVTLGVGADGRVYAVQQVAIGNIVGTATNALSGVFASGVSNTPVVFLSFQNFTVHTLNGSTSTVGFANVPFDTINSLHGNTLTISNFLTNLGITLTNRGTSEIDLGGTMNTLSNSAANILSLTGSSATPTQQWAGSTSWPVIVLPSTGNGTIKFVPNGQMNGITPSIALVVSDGSNSSYLHFARDGAKSAEQLVGFNNAGQNLASLGLEPSGNATGDKYCLNFSTGTSVGGLIVVNQDANDTGLSAFQFYENDANFPRILFTNGKQTLNNSTPDQHETYASFGAWNIKGVGGALTVIGSNETWFGFGRASGSVSGTKTKEYPTNSVSGFILPPPTSTQSNQSFVVLRDQTNGIWCIGIDTNGILGAYRTNDFSTALATY